MSKRTSFLVDLRASMNEALGNAEEVVKDATLTLVTKIVLKTPIDTGRLQKNWNTKLRTADLTLHEVGAQDSPSRAMNELLGFNLEVKQIWVTNNLPYAYDIEYGKSKVKAPQGMMRVSLQEFDMIFKNSAMKINKGAGSKQNRYLP